MCYKYKTTEFNVDASPVRELKVITKDVELGEAVAKKAAEAIVDVNKNLAAAKQAAKTQVSNNSKEDNSLMLSSLTKEDIPVSDPLDNLKKEQETEELFVNNATTGFLEGVTSGSLHLPIEFTVLVDLPKKTQDPCGLYSEKNSLTENEHEDTILLEAELEEVVNTVDDLKFVF